MTAFSFLGTVPVPTVMSTALGTGSSQVFQSGFDEGKAVVLGTNNNHVLATGGNEIRGFVTSVEPETVNGGYSLGGIQVDGYVQAVVGANQGSTPMAVGDFVVADTQLALGVAGSAQQWTTYPGTAPSNVTGPTAQVKTGNPTKFFWQVIALVSGAGAAGSVVLLQHI